LDHRDNNPWRRTAVIVHRALWNKPEAWDTITEQVKEKVPSYDGIDEMSDDDSHASSEPEVAVFVNLQKILQPKPYEDGSLLCTRFLIRDEYLELDKYLSDPTNRRHVLLLGQPGIGMRIFVSPMPMLHGFINRKNNLLDILSVETAYCG
jgi:hypothetical protein